MQKISGRDGRQIIQPQRPGKQAIHLRNKSLEVRQGDMRVQSLLIAPGFAHIERIRRIAQLKQGVIKIARLLTRGQQERPQGLAQRVVVAGFAVSTAINEIASPLILKALQHDFAHRTPGFQLRVRFLQIGGGDGAVVLAEGGLNGFIVNQRRHAGQQLMLGDHVRRCEH